MKSLKIVLICICIVLQGVLYAQNDRKTESQNKTQNKKQDNSSKINSLADNSNQNTTQETINDFVITASNSSYIEIEFNPQYINDYEFLFVAKNSKDVGKPDVGYRAFPLFLPVDNNNKIEIIDSKYTEIKGIDIPPVPKPIQGANKIDFSFSFIKDNSVFNSNNPFPANLADIDQSGKLRNKYYGIAKIYPAQYYPLSKSIRKYSYIKFRVTYGGNPIPLSKPLNKEEIDFFNGLALNSGISMNWSTKEFNDKKLNPAVITSVLSSGDFYKIEVIESGIYKIDKNYLINAGIDVNNIDPRTIKMYNNGGAELPYDNAVIPPIDLNETIIDVENESGGVFTDSTYILFYGVAPNDWNYSSVKEKYSHYINHYSKSNFYWLTFGGTTQGKRMQKIQSINVGNLSPVQSFTDRFFDEPEINNLGATGTLWLSQAINAGDAGFIFSHQLPGLIDGSPIHYVLRFGNGSKSYPATFSIKDDNSNYYNSIYVGPASADFSHIVLTAVEDDFTLNAGVKNLTLRLSLPALYNNSSVTGYYDYLELFYNRSFNSVVNNSIQFRSNNSTTGNVEYQISPFNTPDVKIFDISTSSIIIPISYNSGVVRFQDAITQSSPKNYYVIGGSNFKTPNSISQKIPNQNIQGMTNSSGFDGASFVIISPTEFLSAANALKSIREAPGPGNPNYLKTVVIEVNQIYNEFSCGSQDPVAFRNFLKYAFNNWTTRPVYVLLLGAGNYDYKNIVSSRKNFVPPIEKPDDQSNDINSYPSDDFIVDINSSHATPTVCIPDFSVGRFSIISLNDANSIIYKIQAYESTSTFGKWKKKNMYVADDGWTTIGNDRSIHTDQCERIAELFTPHDFEKEKIYIVSYPTVITPQGRRKPGANVDIIKGWNDGRLVINYVGHGSIDLWAHEHIFVRDESIPQLTNTGKYPLVTIASCDLARWDDPLAVSAGEQLVYIDGVGAIAVVAAVRPVYSNYNATFNETLWSNFMYYKDTLNLPIRIGKAIYNAKNQLGINLNDNDMKYTLMGDPTLRISIPQYFTRIDSINNISGNNTATIKALQKVKITGSVLRPDSTFWANYNGDITIKILDVDRNILIYDLGDAFNFKLDGGTIFNGSTKITNGKWNVEFIVPKDISYNTGKGKLTAYFKNDNSEGSGYTGNFVLNGIDTNAPIDTTGPKIAIYLDNRNFRTGDLVNQNATILSDFFDESGINLTGAIGHKIEAILNNDENNKIDLTQYYNNTNGYQYGTLSYPLQNLADGKYNLKLRAWDTYNNFSESLVDFTVKSNTVLVIDKVYNYPNPFRDNTSFTFQHNSDSPLNVKIKIYTVRGKLIQEIIRTNIPEKNVIIEWDGKDSDGDAIANGTYLYKVFINSNDGTFSTNSTGKIAKLK
jgi:hypothetical protein